jgi:hypothetical protein
LHYSSAAVIVGTAKNEVAFEQAFSRRLIEYTANHRIDFTAIPYLSYIFCSNLNFLSTYLLKSSPDEPIEIGLVCSIKIDQ